MIEGCQNLIQANVLSFKYRTLVPTSSELVYLKSGTDHKTNVLGILVLEVRIGCTIGVLLLIVSEKKNATFYFAASLLPEYLTSVHEKRKLFEPICAKLSVLPVARMTTYLIRTIKK